MSGLNVLRHEQAVARRARCRGQCTASLATTNNVPRWRRTAAANAHANVRAQAYPAYQQHFVSAARNIAKHVMCSSPLSGSGTDGSSPSTPISPSGPSTSCSSHESVVGSSAAPVHHEGILAGSPAAPSLPGSTNQHPQPQENSDMAAARATGLGTSSPEPAANVIVLKPRLVLGVVFALTFGILNRVLYKMALIPMQNYIFFLAQLQNAVYLVVYFSTLAMRHRAGLVTDAMLAMDKRPLWAVGACEAVAQLLFMMGASHLPGALLPVISQSYLAWNLALAALLLGTKFSAVQLLGVSLVMAGVVVAAVPLPQLLALLPQALQHQVLGGPNLAGAAASAGGAGLEVQPGYVLICVLSFACSALAAIIKDKVFRKQREKLGQPLDIFVVNSFGSLYQAVFVLLLLPVTTAMYGLSLAELPAYLSEGAARMLQPGSYAEPGMAVLPLAYIAANLVFNIAMLRLLRGVGTVTTSIVGACLVPLTVAAFCLPLPYLVRP